MIIILTMEIMAFIDDMYSHHFTNANSPYNDGWTQEFHQKELEKMDYEPKRDITTNIMKKRF